jgi:8-oxo-dGTP diphosphatase
MSDEWVGTEIAIAVVECDGRYLVGVRGSDVALAGFDEFPGGKVKAGELPARAAERECLEETGVAVEAGALVVPVVEHSYAHGELRLHFFHCRPLGEALEPRAPFRWVPASELSKLRFPAANRVVIETLAFRHIQKIELEGATGGLSASAETIVQATSTPTLADKPPVAHDPKTPS